MYFIDLFAHLVHFLVGSLIITDSSGSLLVRLDVNIDVQGNFKIIAWVSYNSIFHLYNFIYLNHKEMFCYFSDARCNGIIVGNVTNDELNELSGLAESHRFPNVFYSIQDSGNNPSVYVINSDGSLRGIFASITIIFYLLILNLRYELRRISKLF